MVKYILIILLLTTSLCKAQDKNYDTFLEGDSAICIAVRDCILAKTNITNDSNAVWNVSGKNCSIQKKQFSDIFNAKKWIYRVQLYKYNEDMVLYSKCFMGYGYGIITIDDWIEDETWICTDL